MKEQIVEQIVKARQEAIMWANHEIKAIAVKYQGRKDKKELLEAELLKAREFQDSDVGNGYINSLAPIYENDETLVSAIANYYMSSKVVTNPDTRTGWTEESTQKYVYDDSFTFLRRYYLASYLSLMLNPPIPQEILQLFKSEQVARCFLEKLNSNSDAADVVYYFRMYSEFDTPEKGGVIIPEFWRALRKLNLYGQSDKNLTYAFHGKNMSKKMKKLLE